jgi:hypothetical protein
MPKKSTAGSMTHSRIAACLTFFIASLLMAGCTSFGSLPSDAKLKNLFFKHQQEFKTMVQMSDQDSHVRRIDPNFFNVDSRMDEMQEQAAFPGARWDAYRKLFRSTGTERGLVRRDDYPGAVFFLTKGLGLPMASSTKGIAFCPSKPLPLVPSLDELSKNSYDKHEHAVAFVDLGHGWYLWREEYE